MLALLCFGLLLVIACGSSPSGSDARTDPPEIDASISVDASSPSDQAELTPIAGRVTGGGMTMDVQVGHFYAQQPATGGSTGIEGGAAIK